jgi:DNA-directed RNA polymerase subunit RPC12/RpoP
MPYILAILAALILAVILSTACCRRAPSGTGSAGTAVQTAPAAVAGSRSDIAQRLAVLASSKPPKSNDVSAMCYFMAITARSEYVCPVCGSKTIYAITPKEPGVDRVLNDSWEAIKAVDAVVDARRLASQLPVIKAELDESQFCKQCSPEIMQPQLILIIKYQDGTAAQRTEGIACSDILLLNAFLTGQVQINTGDGEKPVRDYMPRLQELLGVKAE